jgi:RecA-family ATPase
MEREIKPSRVYDLMTRELETAPAWIGTNLLTKRGILLFGGLEKIGKSLIGLEVARALTTKTPLFGYPEFHVEEKARVLMVEMEIGEYGLQDRTRLVFGKEDPAVYGDFFWYVSQESSLQLDSREGMKALTEVIDVVQPNVLILDPISNLHGWNENENTEIEQLFRVLQSLITAYQHNDMSVVIAHHFGKSASYKDSKIEIDPLERRHFRGAGKWLAGPDTLVTMHRSRELTRSSWELKTRTTVRHGVPPPEMTLVVNRNNDLRVRFEHEKGSIAPLVKPGPRPLSEIVKAKPAVQTDLTFGDM